jgi:hypothetical protein
MLPLLAPLPAASSQLMMDNILSRASGESLRVDSSERQEAGLCCSM